MLRILSLFLFISSAFYSFGQDLGKKEPNWYEGYIVTDKGERFEGMVSFDYKRKIALFKKESKITTFTARETHHFSYYEEQDEVHRTFLSIEHKPKGYPVRDFYELVMDGPLQLFRDGEEKKNQKPFYKYMALLDGQFISLSKFPSRILPTLLEREPDLQKILDTYPLRTWETFDQIVLIDQYNALSDPAYVLQINIEAAYLLDIR